MEIIEGKWEFSTLRAVPTRNARPISKNGHGMQFVQRLSGLGSDVHTSIKSNQNRVLCAHIAQVAFASRAEDVACWSASLTLSGAARLADAHALFYVSPVPAAAKLAPALLRGAAAAVPEKGRGSAAAAVPGTVARAVLRSRGLVVRLAPTAAGALRSPRRDRPAKARAAAAATQRAAALAAKWAAAKFGLAGAEHGDVIAAFFPMAEAHEVAGLAPPGDAAAALRAARASKAFAARFGLAAPAVAAPRGDAAAGHGGASRHGHPAWRAARKTAAATNCARLLAVEAPASRASTGALRLSLQRRSRRRSRASRTGADAVNEDGAGEDEDEEAPSAEEEACALVLVAYLAAQPEVLSVDVAPRAVALAHLRARALPKEAHEAHASSAARPRNNAGASVAERVAAAAASAGVPPRAATAATDDDGAARWLDGGSRTSAAATSLQSSDVSDPRPAWAVGLTGAHQLVQVVDTGFDDASCWLRDTGFAAAAAGRQVARSTWDAPFTNASLRKVVQYVSADASDAAYGYDYAAGHGTHVAATVCGSLDAGDGSTFAGTALDAYSTDELDCSSYLSACSALFCPACSYAHYCDATCGFALAGNASVYSGMAPAAQVFGYDVGDADGGLAVPGDLGAMVFAPAYASGARVHTNSWGYTDYQDYEGDCVSTDQYMYDYPDALVLFAAGNDGASGNGSVGAPAVAKNLLSVGAAETQAAPDTVADFSSFGPTYDQRIKPDVLGPGDPIAAARASGSLKDPTCDVVEMSGTSMATPAVAGAAALVRQFLTEAGRHQAASPLGFKGSSYNATAPSGSLLKALLVAAAVPVGWGYVDAADDDGQMTQRLSAVYAAAGYGANATLDYHQGFGHVALSHALPLRGADAHGFETFLVDSHLSNYSAWEANYTVAAPGPHGVSVTLAWTDPPGVAYCGSSYADGYTSDGCLVHDLDLEVSLNGARVYSNWGGASGGSESGVADSKNNVERVVLASGVLAAGNCIDVKVTTGGLSYADNQTFSLVVTGNLTEGGHFVMPTPLPTQTFQPTKVPTSIPTTETPTKLPTPAPTLSVAPTISLVPTPSPTQCTDYTVVMSDSFGDGWNSNTLHIGRHTATLDSGSSGTATVCLDAGTAYTPYACGGSFDSEVSWTVGGVSGGADDTCSGTSGSFTATSTTTSTVEGTCYSSDSTATVLAANGNHEQVPLSALEEGQRILALDQHFKPMFAKVLGAPHSAAKEPYVEIKTSGKARSSVLKATPHHFFPLCGKGHTGAIRAQDLQRDDCLHTVHGQELVRSVQHVATTSADVTYSLKMASSVDMVAIGGIFTHAKADHAQARSPPAFKSNAQASSLFNKSNKKHMLSKLGKLEKKGAVK